MNANSIPSPVAYPSVTVGGKQYHLAWGPAARYHLARWGFWDGANVGPNLAWVAAMIGTLDKDGRWHSLRLADPTDLADMMLPGEHENAFVIAADEAIKNTQPDPTPGGIPAPTEGNTQTSTSTPLPPTAA